MLTLPRLHACLPQGKGAVHAFDKDAVRLRRLRHNAQLTGADRVITAHEQDFLSVDTQAPEFAQVRGWAAATLP